MKSPINLADISRQLLQVMNIAYRIHVSEDTRSILLTIGGFRTEFRGPIELKVLNLKLHSCSFMVILFVKVVKYFYVFNNFDLLSSFELETLNQ